MNIPTICRACAIADVITEMSYRWHENPIATYHGQVIAELDELPSGDWLVLLDNREIVVLKPEHQVELALDRKETT